ncbi:MAG: carboxypeptidase-like regulatory domain-containing protein, partial [Muribaculaceae bacterium]|nr:carboxypeptidase-like regulatory domain-containing protein [Muribaculaceae bacterium]
MHVPNGVQIKNKENTHVADLNLQSDFARIAASILPKEKVYLHLDNTSYYHDDTLWFSAYIVNPDGNTSTELSKTLYVELLNPGGDIVDTKILNIVNGRAHGNFKIDCIPFYSGFFEIRAYTKYMMNFGPETAFTRLIPVFDASKPEKGVRKRNMRTYGSGQYTYNRKRPEKGKDIQVSFYPEGGNLIKGSQSRIAFEAKDKNGHPLDITGYVLTGSNDTLSSFKTLHEGKGVFNIVADGSQQYAVVYHNGKSKKFMLPETRPDGFSISVDNLSHKDSVSVTIDRTGIFNRIDTVGIVLTNHGTMKSYSAVASTFRRPLHISFDRRDLSAGIAEVTLVDMKGRKIADRMIFNMPDSTDFINFRYLFDKKEYKPHEAINMSVFMSDAGGNPVRSPFSLSIRDRNDEIEWKRDICTDLLLIADIKGYVANPAYYFESADSIHLRDLDLLMMVQGWRKYPWETLTVKNIENMHFKPEKDGIDINGTVRSLTNKPMAEVDVTAFLMKGENTQDKSIPPMDVTRTDSAGRFSFTANIEDRWQLILNTTKNSKLIDSQISLDKEYIPQARQYARYEMEVHTESDHDGSSSGFGNDSTDLSDESDIDMFKSLYPDDKSVWLDEVVVKHKKNWLDDARSQARKRSVAYYEVDDEIDALRDAGEYVNTGCDIHGLIMKLNPQFTRVPWYGDEYLSYKQKMPLIVVDYERISGPTQEEYFRYKDVRLESIKSISISEDVALKGKYCWERIPPSIADHEYSCVVMIETYPDGKIMVDGGKGIRKTKIHGYDTPQEFYSPDYSVMPVEE